MGDSPTMKVGIETELPTSQHLQNERQEGRDMADMKLASLMLM